MERIYINDNWKYSASFDEKMLSNDFDDSLLEEVRIPHTCKELPFHYFDEKDYQFECCYRRSIAYQPKWEGKRIILTFDGVAHRAVVYLNGERLMEHNSGYTAFSLELTGLLKPGEDNQLAIYVDTRESLNVPPFGFVIDYLTYGGIYRDVYLDIKEKTYIKDVFVRYKDDVCDSDVYIDFADDNPNDYRVMQRIFDGEKLIETMESSVVTYEGARNTKTLDAKNLLLASLKCKLTDINKWSPENPYRYKVKTELFCGREKIDEHEFMTAFRQAEFSTDGFYLNGQKYKIRGLNRHQSFAYVGYAMPESMQRFDAMILKKELGCNAVRTSHYPQSHYFIDECDRLGLLVFMEFPGWQHIGDDEWKEQAFVNLDEMIVQYRNHPSIILWGVRINESKDDDSFYKRTNDIAHKLDDSRQTGGVRAHKNSNLFEDVYTYNDFVHDGSNIGCEPKKKVTSDINKGYLVTEYNGHMYPTKAYDWEEHRMEHMLRHARVLNQIAQNDDIAGSFGWCMFDYNTHKDFGSGDRICYHGVMDMFRNPKLAAAIYSMQQDEVPILELSSSMDIGEHPGCNRGKTYILTNADSVRMYKNDIFIKEYDRSNSDFKYLKNGPITIDDFLGDEISKNENFSKKQSELVKDILNHVAINGYKLPAGIIAKAAKCMLLYRMSFSDALTLYNKYIGDWGGKSTVYRFDAIKDGEVVKTITKCPMTSRRLHTDCSHVVLKEKNTYDVAQIRISMRDENENLLYFSNDPLVIKTEGPIELIGPDVISLQGGMSGVYVKTTGVSGKASVTIASTTGESKKIDLNVIAD